VYSFERDTDSPRADPAGADLDYVSIGDDSDIEIAAEE
jgi:hypothetical protein